MNIQTTLDSHRSRSGEYRTSDNKEAPLPSTSIIPDLFFDNILVQYELNQMETMVLMFLYRQVWCRPNLYRKYGVSPVFSIETISSSWGVAAKDIHLALDKLRALEFIELIRSGQYFVRKYFTKDFDKLYRQNYDGF